MSSTEQDDPLGGLLRSVRERKNPSPTEQPAAGGLNPLDLLGLPSNQRDLINWLARRKQAGFEAIRHALQMDEDHLTSLLGALKAAGHIHEALIDGDIFYRVVFGGKVSRAARGLPKGIWDRVDLDNVAFLRQIALFRGLDETALRQAAEKLVTRRYQRNEVILWQGGIGEGIYFVKSGIVGITRLSPDRQRTHILTYLKQGDVFGEYRLLFEQNAIASSTVTALSEVEVLVMPRDDMMVLLKDQPSVTLELVQMLTRRLQRVDVPSSPGEQQATLCLVLGVAEDVGATVIGSAVAMKLAHATQNATVYTEYPNPATLPSDFGFPREKELHVHPTGYHIWVPRGLAGMPPEVRTTLVTDKLVNNYANIVIGISSEFDETAIYMLQRASQVLLVAPPTASAWERIVAIKERIQSVIQPDRTRITLLCNRPAVHYATGLLPDYADLDIPFLQGMPPLTLHDNHNLPESLAGVVNLLAERMGRTNRIGVYLPRDLTDADDQRIDTSVALEQLHTFFDLLFGNAERQVTQSPAGQGEPTERVVLVQTYVTKAAMDRRLAEVLAYVEQLKEELGQDALAVEVNHNVMLV